MKDYVLLSAFLMIFSCPRNIFLHQTSLSRVKAQKENGYERFLSLNPAMLKLCTDWQVIDDGLGEQKLNDHKDASYDEKILERLIELDSGVGEILQSLEQALQRFDNYSSRFTFALQKLKSGELEWLTKPIMPSYHTVWFELHEDLLATLGIDRGSELSE